MPSSHDHTRRPKVANEHLDAIADALAQLRFGVIQLTVHDGKLMQLDVTERTRFG